MKIKFESEKLERLLKLAPSFWEDSQIMRRLAAYGASKIKERTAKGNDYQEKSFAPYAISTEKLRKSAGRPINFVDLDFTGKMIGAITSDGKKGEGQIYFLSTKESEKAYKHMKGNRKLPQREFFRLSKKDMNKITDMLNTHVSEKLDKYS